MYIERVIESISLQSCMVSICLHKSDWQRQEREDRDEMRRRQEMERREKTGSGEKR